MCKKFLCHHSITRMIYCALIAVIATASLVLGINVSPQPARADAAAVSDAIGAIKDSFGGFIEVTRVEVCLIPVSFFPFVLPIPFRYIEIGDPDFEPFDPLGDAIPDPSPAKVYYIYLASQQHDEDHMGETGHWTLGNYIPGASEAFRSQCLNANLLPKADGVVVHIGTSPFSGIPIGNDDFKDIE